MHQSSPPLPPPAAPGPPAPPPAGGYLPAPAGRGPGPQLAMAPTDAEMAGFAQGFAQVVNNICLAVVGKQDAVALVVTALFAGGHVLIEDVPGTGKTSLARSLAASVEMSHSRIQFTPDLLPSDVVGVTVWDQPSASFEFHPGPVFAGVVLADEINRASPKTQSALLEVMEENQVTVDGVTHRTPVPFMVIATQNPIEQAGTYRLPEAQLDRFLLRVSLGFPGHEAGMEILADAATRDRAAGLRAVIGSADVMAAAQLAGRVHTEKSILDYVLRLAQATHGHALCQVGVSMRGALALVRCAKVWAAAQGRGYVIPDDIARLVQPVWAHRLVMRPEAEMTDVRASDVVAEVLEATAPALGRRA